jgi:hypothetical protein
VSDDKDIRGGDPWWSALGRSGPRYFEEVGRRSSVADAIKVAGALVKI